MVPRSVTMPKSPTNDAGIDMRLRRKYARRIFDEILEEFATSDVKAGWRHNIINTSAFTIFGMVDDEELVTSWFELEFFPLCDQPEYDAAKVKAKVQAAYTECKTKKVIGTFSPHLDFDDMFRKLKLDLGIDPGNGAETPWPEPEQVVAEDEREETFELAEDIFPPEIDATLRMEGERKGCGASAFVVPMLTAMAYMGPPSWYNVTEAEDYEQMHVLSSILEGQGAISLHDRTRTRRLGGSEARAGRNVFPLCCQRRVPSSRRLWP